MRCFTKVVWLAFLVVLVVSTTSLFSDAQTYGVLYSFVPRAGTNPTAGLSMDQAGNLYGTASQGGLISYGSVYRLSHKGSSWVFQPLYSFLGGSDGAKPTARVIFGPDGALYGTTSQGGGSGCGGKGCGTVFILRPPPHPAPSVFGNWTITILYRFQGGNDGANPGYGDLIFDSSGNLYGTTVNGGTSGAGTIFRLAPSGGGWTESVLYSFTGGSNGGNPYSGVVLDKSGSLYGTTVNGGAADGGVVYKLVPSEGSWTESVLYSFTGGADGGLPYGGVIFDGLGNLYGGTSAYGTGGGGTVYMLSPSESGWTPTVLFGFANPGSGTTVGPWSSLIMDPAGRLYGTTSRDGNDGYGSVFRLTPSSAGVWSYISLHDFAGGGDGQQPFGSVILDAKGNIYGTTFAGGGNNWGLVWEIAP